MELSLFIVLVGTVTVTSYRPVPAQTKLDCIDRHYCETSTGENVSELGVAVSPDLLRSKRVRYGDVLYIDGYGFRTVDDTMAEKNHDAVDLFVYTKSEEKRVGTQHRVVWVIRAGGGK